MNTIQVGFVRRANADANRTLCNLMAALHELDRMGCVVMGCGFVTSDRNPVIYIDRSVPQLLDGASVKRETRGGMVRVRMVARLHDCQVEWQETRALPGRHLNA